MHGLLSVLTVSTEILAVWCLVVAELSPGIDRYVACRLQLARRAVHGDGSVRVAAGQVAESESTGLAGRAQSMDTG